MDKNIQLTLPIDGLKQQLEKNQETKQDQQTNSNIMSMTQFKDKIDQDKASLMAKLYLDSYKIFDLK